MMGFTPTFYAGRPKLSEITIDSDLDMGGRNILRARIGSPYMPETWPTETLDWGDVPASPAVYLDESVKLFPETTNVPIMSWTTPASVSYRWILYLVADAGKKAPLNISIKVNGAVTDTFEAGANGAPANRVLNLPSNAAVTVTASNPAMYDRYIATESYYQFTGIVVGPKTFDLTGKWLTLGLDMKGLEATVKIQGVEMPYSDYPLYFPLAPTELKIPGNWSHTQERPVIEVYK